MRIKFCPLQRKYCYSATIIIYKAWNTVPMRFWDIDKMFLSIVMLILSFELGPNQIILFVSQSSESKCCLLYETKTVLLVLRKFWMRACTHISFRLMSSIIRHKQKLRGHLAQENFICYTLFSSNTTWKLMIKETFKIPWRLIEIKKKYRTNIINQSSIKVFDRFIQATVNERKNIGA